MLAHRPKRRRGSIHAIQMQYASRLRKVAAQVDVIVNGFSAQDPNAGARIASTLNRYAESLHEWAEKAARHMLIEAERREAKQWKMLTQELSRALRTELRSAPTGEVMRALLQEQVELVQSIPREVAQRVHELAQEGIVRGVRSGEIAKEIMRSGEIAASRANLIARTETSRVAMAFTQARAQHIGSEEFIWRTAGDGDVRPGHKKLANKVFRWDSPPAIEEGDGKKKRIYYALPGCIFNCRCYAEPVIPE
jgi:SPP1 gp7 family putative phage head morphogenesis protein